MQAGKENFIVCLEYLHAEALRVGLPFVAGIVRNATEEIRRCDGNKAKSLGMLSTDSLQDDLFYAFHIFLAYMQTDSKGKRLELLAALQNMETLFDHADIN